MVSTAGFRVLCVKRPQVSVVMPTTVAQRRHISTPHWAALASARCRKHICTPVDPLFNNKSGTDHHPDTRHQACAEQ